MGDTSINVTTARGLRGQTEYSAQPKKCEDSANDNNQSDDVDNGAQDNLLLWLKHSLASATLALHQKSARIGVGQGAAESAMR